MTTKAPKRTPKFMGTLQVLHPETGAPLAATKHRAAHPTWEAYTRMTTELDRLRAENAEMREAAEAVAAMLGDTPRDRLGRLDIVATDTREAVRRLAVKYDVAPARDYMGQCANVLRAVLAKAKGGA